MIRGCDQQKRAIAHHGFDRLRFIRGVAGLVENIRTLQAEKNCTVLMVEHHMDVLMGLVEKVAVMYFGTIIAYDTPQAIMDNPLVQSAYLGTGTAA